MMNRITLSLRQFPVATFCLLTVLLSLASYFLPVPREALPFIFVLVPSAVALILVATTEGLAGVRRLLSKLTRWRTNPAWVLGALLLALVMRLAVGVAGQMMGLIPSVSLVPQNPTQVIILALIYLVAAILEELGWRGFALSRLLTRQSPLFSAVALGVPWGIIHIALHFPGMWAEGLPWLLTVLQLVALSVVITWFFVRSGQSLLVAIVFHAAQSAFGFLNEGLAPLHVTWLMTVVWSATAALVALDMVASARQRKPLAPAT